MPLSDSFDEVEREMFNRVELAQEEILEAAREYTPHKTGQLASSQVSLRPVRRKGDIIGIISAQARDKGGFDYAIIQRDLPLHHAHKEGNKHYFTGFVELGTGSSLEERYSSGYARHGKDFPAYATEFFIKGYLEKEDIIDDIMGVK